MGLIDRLRRRPPQSAQCLGRNEPCWCGSGKKYKHCHHDSDLQYFSRALEKTHRGST